MVEQSAVNRLVAGSNPAVGANKKAILFRVAFFVAHNTHLNQQKHLAINIFYCQIKQLIIKTIRGFYMKKFNRNTENFICEHCMIF